jgi:hypothetical protein
MDKTHQGGAVKAQSLPSHRQMVENVSEVTIPEKANMSSRDGICLASIVATVALMA